MLGALLMLFVTQPQQAILPPPPPPISHGPLFQVYFEPGSVTLTPEARAGITRAADHFDRIDNQRVFVVGHTDTVGSGEENQRLSERRAEAVRAALAAAGVDVTTIRVEGRGETDLAIASQDEEPQPLNRRVFIDYSGW